MRILFSPLGDTDPVRGCYDGAMLHIVRHYQPERIVLFYTHDMAEKERHDHRYTRAVQRLAPECQIEEVFTEIRDAHLYESFSRILPQEVLRIRETYPGSTLLLNLSSGTPQMKTVLAMLASDMEHCIGVQVAAPARHSNCSKTILTTKKGRRTAVRNHRCRRFTTMQSGAVSCL